MLKLEFRSWIQLGLLGVGSLLVQAAYAESVNVLPSPTPSISPIFSPSPSPSPSSNSIPSPIDPKQLLKSFEKAQKNEIKSLEHRNRFELKELKSSQAARREEWRAKEKKAREEFFAKRPKGPEVRAYMKDYIERLKAFDKILADEKTKRQQDQTVRINSTRYDQSVKLKEFKEALGRGERPSQNLWPAEGG